MEEIGAALPPVPFSWSVCGATEAVLLFGDDSQRDRWLPGMARGEIIGCIALADSIDCTGAIARDDA